MQVVILCGGRGTRLGDQSDLLPKPMIEIGNKPILWHIMRHFARYGHTEFILCLGYKGHMIKEYFLNYEKIENDLTIELGDPPKLCYHSQHPEQGWKITLANTGLDANTGARVKRIEKYITADEFFLTYGDGVSDIDLEKLLEFHHSHDKTGTITAVHPPARFGELRLSEGEVKVFSEKPQTSAGMINGGFGAFNRGIFNYLSDDATCSLEHEALTNLSNDGQLMAYQHHGFWQCVDTVRELSILRNMWESGNAPWKES